MRISCALRHVIHGQSGKVCDIRFLTVQWRDARVDFVAHLIAVTTEAASAALLAVDDLRCAIVSRSTVPSGEIWE